MAINRLVVSTGTSAEITNEASLNSLLPGELYYVSDKQLAAIGTGVNSYASLLAASDVTIAGFVNRTDTSLSFNSGTRVFSLTKVSNFRVWAASVPYDYTETQTTTIANATNLYYIYIDTDGVLKNSTSVWDIDGGAAPVATLYFNTAAAAEYQLGDERHSYRRNPLAHKVQHQSIGAYWISGLAGTFGDTNGSISITSGTYADEDIVHSIGSASTASEVYRASGAWRVDAAGADIRKQATSIIQYDNSGTLADVTLNWYVCYWVYATNSGVIQVLIGQGQDQQAASAVARSPDTLTLPPWLQAEGRLLYKIIYQRTNATSAGDIYQTPTDYRLTRISGGITIAGTYQSTSLPDGQIWVGNSSGAATAVTPSGAVTMTNAGVFAFADADITAIAALSGTGYAQRTAENTWTLSTPSSGSETFHPFFLLGA